MVSCQFRKSLIWEIILIILLPFNRFLIIVLGRDLRELPRPNFVILLADDLGIGDIGCFGNDTIKTPNIDYICRNGVKLEHNLAPESICTPSRAAFLTGRYAVRSGVAAGQGSIRVFATNSVRGGLPSNETTFASVLQRAGYRTSFIGKWHLGVSCKDKFDFCHHPMNHGFDTFYGLSLSRMKDCDNDNYNSSFSFIVSRGQYVTALTTSILLVLISLFASKCRVFLIAFCFIGILISASGLVYHRLYKIDTCILMRNFTVVEQPVFGHDMTQRFATEAAHFLQKQSKQEPFLLFLSFAKVHTTLFTTPYFKNHSVHGKYGDNVEEMDWAVGVVLSSLRANGFLNNTFVYFTSDHGPHLEEKSDTGEYVGGSKGKFKGGKGTSWEGGIRVPTMAMWNGIIQPGRTITFPTSSMDVFTTVIKLAKQTLPEDRHIDGKDLFSQLMGDIKTTPHTFLFHYCGLSLEAVTYVSTEKVPEVWKVHFSTPVWSPGMEHCGDKSSVCNCYGPLTQLHDPPLLYALHHDPYEQNPVEKESATFKNIIETVQRGVENHKETLASVPNQLEQNSMIPRNIHHCDYPFIPCYESFPHKLISMNFTFS